MFFAGLLVVGLPVLAAVLVLAAWPWQDPRLRIVVCSAILIGCTLLVTRVGEWKPALALAGLPMLLAGVGLARGVTAALGDPSR